MTFPSDDVPQNALVPLDSLTPYERVQVDHISRWKSLEPSRLTVVIEAVTTPIVWIVCRCVPRSAVAKLVHSLEIVAAKSDGIEDVKRAAGVASLDEMFQKPLEECDRLAKRYCSRAERMAIVATTLSGFGGPFVHMPTQLMAALRSIARIGHCYGYSLDTAADRALIIDILEISMIQEREERLEVLDRLHEAIRQHSISRGGVTDYLVRSGRNMIAEEIIDFVPIVGHAVSFVFDNTFMHNVDAAARRIFKERWLIDTGRLAAPVPPAPEPQRANSLGEVGLAMGQAVYTLAATLGFMATLPVALVGRLVFRGRGPVVRGLRHGAMAAIEDAHEFQSAVLGGEAAEAFVVEPIGPVALPAPSA